ncbi:toxin-antitoxin system HicB family antitoxin [Novosphingobium olei]|uniref:Toxin-antitoxin system HicB family antitoxin n=1 Tax=Novosphingobium olei TaxID=2728851 RepID=A0A7Y0BT54_9SPHN|nr:toxin-antitoxin system HicB family antitoxin [Novosphingobium olei]NML96071.1 toxin-antitoxin system HicB family antitoxin [Novosphingobium olei]
MASPGKKAFALRLDPALHAAVERAAARDLRSVNAEIECLLREALARRGVRVGADKDEDER